MHAQDVNISTTTPPQQLGLTPIVAPIQQYISGHEYGKVYISSSWLQHVLANASATDVNNYAIILIGLGLDSVHEILREVTQEDLEK